jgi:hypothetical protein
LQIQPHNQPLAQHWIGLDGFEQPQQLASKVLLPGAPMALGKGERLQFF